MAVAPQDQPQLLIRVAQAADVPAVLEIERASFPVPWTERMFFEELTHDWSHFWVVEAGAEGGIAAFTVFWLAYDEVHILNIAVAPAWRRQGVGRRLLEAIVAFARARAASHLVLEVRPSNLIARHLYDTCQFRPVGIRPRYYADNGEDAIVMVRLLR